MDHLNLVPWSHDGFLLWHKWVPICARGRKRKETKSHASKHRRPNRVCHPRGPNPVLGLAGNLTGAWLEPGWRLAGAWLGLAGAWLGLAWMVTKTRRRFGLGVERRGRQGEDRKEVGVGVEKRGGQGKGRRYGKGKGREQLKAGKSGPGGGFFKQATCNHLARADPCLSEPYKNS